MAKVELRGVTKTFGPQKVIKGVDLEVASGEFMVLVGPSGCGKSTMLRMIAGLEDATSGDVVIGDRVVNRVSPKDRGVAMVFQSYALYPHMSVRQNLAFALQLAKVPKAEIKARVDEAARILGISDLLHKKPGQLSGGQKQRVAMGRAMVRRPKVFLFDEPLSNLDAQLRVRMRTEISDLHRRLGATIIYVTHDQVEAMTLASRIAVVREGKIEQVGRPLEVYHEPRTKFVAAFIGTPAMNFLPLTPERARLLGLGRPQAATLGFRPEDTRLAAPRETLHANETELAVGSVRLVEPLGALAHVHVSLAAEAGRETQSIAESAEGTVTSETRTSLAPEVGAKVAVRAPTDRLFFFDAEGRNLAGAKGGSGPLNG